MLNPRKSIRAKFSLVVGGWAILVTLLLSLGIASRMETLALNEQGARMTELAKYMMTDLDRSMYHRKHEMLFFSSLVRLRDPRFGARDKRELLDSIQKENPVYTWLGAIDRDGNIVAGSGGLLEGVNVAKRDYFVGAQKGFFAGDVHDAFLLSKKLPPSGDPLPLRLVDVAVPIHDLEGKFSGVLIGHLSIDWARISRDDLLASDANQEKLDLILTTKEGHVLVGPSPEFVLEKRPTDTEQITKFTTSAIPYRMVQWSDGQYLTARVQSTGYRDFPGYGWQILLRKPAAMVVDQIEEIRNEVLIAGLLAVIVLMGAGWYLVGIIVKPLRRIAAAAGQIQRGDETAEIPIFPNQDEVGTLSESMAKLVDGMRGQNEILEQQVTERTHELEKAKTAAEAANRAKSDFLSSMSHELRTPLTAIIGFSQLMRHNVRLSEEFKPQADSIHRAGQHLLELINELLDMAKIEAGKLEVMVQDVSLTETMGQCLELSQALANKHGVRLVNTTDARAMCVVRADPTRLKQVLLNLMSNAIKYNRPEGDVTLALTEAGNDRVRLSVSDTGPGIGPELMAKLFKPFERLGAEKSQVEGTGIGLAITKRLVELMGGELEVTSRPGEGSTFSVVLQRAQSDNVR
jgi:signal transduction histidine kinase